MVVFHRKSVLVVEYWFDEEILQNHADVLRVKQRSTPMNGIPSNDFYTIIVELERSNDDLLAGMRKETRYEIRRASRIALNMNVVKQPMKRILSISLISIMGLPARNVFQPFTRCD